MIQPLIEVHQVTEIKICDRTYKGSSGKKFTVRYIDIYNGADRILTTKLFLEDSVREVREIWDEETATTIKEPNVPGTAI